jgi:hypothetical protein
MKHGMDFSLFVKLRAAEGHALIRIGRKIAGTSTTEPISLAKCVPSVLPSLPEGDSNARAIAADLAERNPL